MSVFLSHFLFAMFYVCKSAIRQLACYYCIDPLFSVVDDVLDPRPGFVMNIAYLE